MRPVVTFGAAGAGEDIGMDADTDVEVVANDDGEDDVTGSSDTAPREGEAPPRGDPLCRSPRSAVISVLKSRAAAQTSEHIFAQNAVVIEGVIIEVQRRRLKFLQRREL